MTEQELLDMVAERSMSCIECDSDFDSVTGFRECAGKSKRWWDSVDFKKGTGIGEGLFNLLKEIHEENQQLKDTNTTLYKQMMKLEKENKRLKKELEK